MIDVVEPSSPLCSDPIAWLRARATACKRAAEAACTAAARTGWEAAASALNLAADDLAAGQGPGFAWLAVGGHESDARTTPVPSPTGKVRTVEEVFDEMAARTPPTDRNAVKRLARSAAQKAGVSIRIVGSDSTCARRGIRKGDPLRSPTEAEPDRAYYRCCYDFDGSAEAAEVARVQGAVDAMRRAGLKVAWSGRLSECLQLFV